MMGGMFLRRVLRGLLLGIVCLGVVPVAAPDGVPSLEECREVIDRNPKNPAAYYCIYRSVLAHRRGAEAAAMLRQYRAENPEVHRIEMFLAWIEAMQGRQGTDAMLARAVDGMEATGDSWGVVYGGLDLVDRLDLSGKHEAAAAMLDRCEAAAAATGERAMEARVWLQRSIVAQRAGKYSEALHGARRVRRVVFPKGPYDLQCSVLDALGTVYWYLCRYEEALEVFEQSVAIREAAGDRWWEAVSAYDAALCSVRLMSDGAMERETALNAVERARKLAEATGNTTAVAQMLILLGSERGGEDGLAMVHRALEMARREGQGGTEADALRAEGTILTEMGPEYARDAGERFSRAVERAREEERGAILLRTLASRARMVALDGTREDAIEAHLETLDAIEAARAPRNGRTIRAQSFEQWAYVYYRLAGFLLQGSSASEGSGDDVALAFRTMERYRARELLSEVYGRGTAGSGTPGEMAGRHRASLERIAKIQRRVVDPAVTGEARAEALEALTRAEEEEQELRDALEGPAGRPDGDSPGPFPGIEMVQAALSENQALLAYQLWDEESWARRPMPIGRSWLVVVTRHSVRPIPLPSRHLLRSRFKILEGLILAPDESAIPTGRAAARLYGDLLRAAIDGLPESIHDLVIVPDDVLFRCPFAMLGPGDGASPVGSRYAISIVPSAGVWTWLKRQEGAADTDGEAAALILVGPSAGLAGTDGEGFRGGGPWREGLQLAPLVNGQREARELERVAGRETVVLSGDAASEAALKSASLHRFRILDLVTHAVVDEEQPERSAIVLAPGNGTEDGLLQVREIPDLDLDGQLVILSSCGSSSGRLLGGEGARSLARAFLEGGASAVLASLWPLEDGDAATLFGFISEALGRGVGVAEALRIARVRAMEAGMPEAGWAGIVVLGDGDLQPFPRRQRIPWWLLLAFAILIALGAVVVIRRVLHDHG